MYRTVLKVGALLALTAGPAAAAGLPKDQINWSQVHIYSSPQDVASWPITTALTHISMRPVGDPAAGLVLTFSGRNTWPDYTPPGWDGPIQYTVWAVWYAAGQWNAAGIIQMWRDRTSTGAPLLGFDPGCTVNNFACNWVYSSRWGPGYGHQPVAGEKMGFFVTPGDARGPTTVTSLRERSNVVMVSLPAGDLGEFSFAGRGGIMTSDFDGDGISDPTVFRPSTGTWFIGQSTTQTGVGIQWGNALDVPVPGDYDGDGKSDVAVYRPSNGTWYIKYSSGGSNGLQWGNATDKPVPGDYDGDGRTDVAVFRPSNGTWYILYARGGTLGVPWGNGSDIPVPGDYDGDGKTDIAVYRPSNGTWYLRASSTGTGLGLQWGNSTDIPVPADYDGDGLTDAAIFRPSTGTWWIRYTAGGGVYTKAWGNSADVPVPGDFDGDGKTDLVVFRPSNGTWYGWLSQTQTSGTVQWGNASDRPVR